MTAPTVLTCVRRARSRRELATKKRAQLAECTARIGQLQQEAASLKEQSEQLRKANGQSASEAAELKEQEGLLASIRAAETETKASMEREKKAMSQNMHARKKDISVMRDAANRWTDGLFQIKSVLVNGGADPKQVDAELKTDRIDYLE